MCLHILLSYDLSTAKLSGIKTALNHQDTGEAGEGQYEQRPVKVPARIYTSTANLNLYSLPFMDFCCKCTVFVWRCEALSETSMTQSSSNQAGVCSHFPLSFVFVCVNTAVCTCDIVLAGIETRPWSCHRNQKLWISAAAMRPVVGKAQEKTR